MPKISVQIKISKILFQTVKVSTAKINETLKVTKHLVLVYIILNANITTDRFKCTRTMGGTFQISSFLVESLWALQCLQNTLLLSVSFSSLENNLRQSCQEAANTSGKHYTAKKLHFYIETQKN